MNERPLIEALNAHRSGLRQQWHTPGHGEHPPFVDDWLRWGADLTEIGNLAPRNDRDDPIHRSEQRMAESFGVTQSWYSVQGASLPVMAGILAATTAIGKNRIVLERTSHRSVLAAMVIGGLDPIWVYPRQQYRGAIADDVVRAIHSSPEVGAVVLTRPTYEGIAEDIAPVISAAHHRHIPVVVDEAHGTHWYGRAGYPTSAIALGADLIAHGTHKTEPTLTQTGLLHLHSDLIPAAAVDVWWRLLGTSSPSYLLLASLDAYQALRHDSLWMTRWRELGEAVQVLWQEFSYLNLLQPHLRGAAGVEVDPAKLTVVGQAQDLVPKILSWGWPEKVDPDGVTLILSPERPLAMVKSMLSTLPVKDLALWQGHPLPRSVQRLSPRAAILRSAERVSMREAEGRIAREPLVPYPPGIPVVQPGEVMSRDVLEWLAVWQDINPGSVEGIYPDPDGQGGSIWVVT